MRAQNLNFAKTLRRNPTEAEQKVWRHLRNRQLAGCKFRRQQSFGPYILDFYCAEINLAIELDGGQHGTPTGAERDHKRDEFLQREGIVVLRFWNFQVMQEFEGVLESIYRACQETTPHPNPLPRRGEVADGEAGYGG